MIMAVPGREWLTGKTFGGNIMFKRLLYETLSQEEHSLAVFQRRRTRHHHRWETPLQLRQELGRGREKRLGRDTGRGRRDVLEWEKSRRRGKRGEGTMKEKKGKRRRRMVKMEKRKRKVCWWTIKKKSEDGEEKVYNKIRNLRERIEERGRRKESTKETS